MKDGNLFFFHSPFMGNRTKRATVCGIYNPETGEMNVGVSVCSELDNFSRKNGRLRAEARARVPMMKFHKETISDIRILNGANPTENYKVFLSIAPACAAKAIVGDDRNLKKYDTVNTTANTASSSAS